VGNAEALKGSMLDSFDYPITLVEADSTIVFCLDADLRITYCNQAWDRFAMANGGEHLCRPAPIGSSVLDHINGPDKQYFEKQYRRVMGQKEPWERDYECSSAEVYRRFRLRVIPMQKRPGLFVMNSLRVERVHESPVCAAIESGYRRPDGFIVMCASCRRTRRPLPGPHMWDWVPAFVENFPPRTTHGVCLPCKELYYPDDEQ
jgi:hypothetical protein